MWSSIVLLETAVLFSSVLSCPVLHLLSCSLLYCTVLCCTVLCCAVLYCAVLYCAVLLSPVLCCRVNTSPDRCMIQQLPWMSSHLQSLSLSLLLFSQLLTFLLTSLYYFQLPTLSLLYTLIPPLLLILTLSLSLSKRDSYIGVLDFVGIVLKTRVRC